MGLYESLGPGGRSEGSVNQIAGAFDRIRQQKREREKKQRLRDLLSVTETELPAGLQRDVEALEASDVTGIDPTQRRKPEGIVGIRSVADQPATRRQRIRGLDELSLGEIFSLGEILGGKAGDIASLIERTESARRPRFGIAETEGKLFETKTDPLRGVGIRELGGPGKREAGSYRYVDAGSISAETLARYGITPTMKRGDKMFSVEVELDASGNPTGNWKLGREVDRPEGDGGRSGKVPDALKELNKLRKDNQELFQKVQTLDTSKIYTDAEGNEIEADDETAGKLREGWLAAMRENQKMMDTLAPKAGRRLRVKLKKEADGYPAGTEGEIDADEFDSRIMTFVDVIE